MWLSSASLIRYQSLLRFLLGEVVIADSNCKESLTCSHRLNDEGLQVESSMEVEGTRAQSRFPMFENPCGRGFNTTTTPMAIYCTFPFFWWCLVVSILIWEQIKIIGTHWDGVLTSAQFWAKQVYESLSSRHDLFHPPWAIRAPSYETESKSA